MDRIRQQLADIQRQLGGLTPSQKMLAASLLAIMVITVVWSTRYAAVGEQVRLLEQPLDAEQVGHIRNLLGRNSIEFRVEGDTIYVPAVKRDEVVSMLALERALPGDLTRHFDKALGQIGSFDPHKKIELTILSARQDALADAIKRWPGVRDARVHVNEQYKRQVGGDIMPTAGITLTSTGGSTNPDKLAEAATHLVAGAFPMLDPSNVETIIDGRLIDSTEEDSVVGGGSRLLDLQARAEKKWENKLLNQLGYIPGLRVAVSVDVSNDTTRTYVEEFDSDGKVVVPLSTTEESTVESVSSGDSWGEAGLNPNSALSIRGDGGGGESRDRRTLEERNQVAIPRTQTEIFSRGGLPTPSSCTVSLPLSWVRTQWQGRQAAADQASTPAEPTPEILREYETVVRQQIADQARTLLAGIGEQGVMVVTYADAALTNEQPIPGLLDGNTTAEAGGLNIAAMVGEYGRPAAVVGLAAVALFFVSGIARKAPAPRSESLGTVDAEGLAALTSRRGLNISAEDDIADALGADPLLVGQEIAEEQLEAGQMVEQVQSLVKENPDAAAQLVKRWINNS